MEKLRIAVISSPVITAPTNASRIPPGWSGAPEEMTLAIADGMTDIGHNVTLYATGETATRAQELVSFTQKSCYEDTSIGIRNTRRYEGMLIAEAYRRAQRGDYDIIHTRFTTESGGHAMLVDIPTVVTLHSPLSDHPRDELAYFATTQNYVSISKRQRHPYEEMLNWAGNIYHGVDLTRFPFSQVGGDHMVMVSRMHREKDPEIAVDIAQRLRIPLQLVGSNWGEPTNSEGRDLYWERVLEKVAASPDLITHHPFVDHDKVAHWYASAKMHLFPALRREEPFGLSVIESMATGTPVIAFAKGAMPELIEDGKTGFLVHASEADRRGDWIVRATGVDGFAEAITRIYHMSEAEYLEMRSNCRERVEKEFRQERMIEDYDHVYRRLRRSP